MIIAAAVIAGAVIGVRALYVRSFGKVLFPAYLPGPYSSLESDMLFADEMTGSAARPNYRELDFARSKIISPKGFWLQKAVYLWMKEPQSVWTFRAAAGDM